MLVDRMWEDGKVHSGHQISVFDAQFARKSPQVIEGSPHPTCIVPGLPVGANLAAAPAPSTTSITTKVEYSLLVHFADPSSLSTPFCCCATPPASMNSLMSTSDQMLVSACPRMSITGHLEGLPHSVNMDLKLAF